MNEFLFEPLCDKTNGMVVSPIEDLDKPGHTTSLIRVLFV